jgi:MFS family permease
MLNTEINNKPTNSEMNPPTQPVVDLTNLSHLESAYVSMETEPTSHATSVMTATGLADPLGFFIICCVVLIGDMNRGVLFPIMWPLVEELGGNAVWLGYAVGAFSFGRIIASPVLGQMSIDYGYSKSLVVSTTIIITGSLLFAAVYRVGSLYFLIFAQVVLGVGSGTLGVTRAYVAEITATRERTKYIALQTAVQYGGFTVTPIFGSFFIWALEDRRYEVG